ncbi:MAG TPA: hypothetical protein PLV24_13300, partial [Anaerolineaceae bacterium]|nr:hypothetical protein [Anaerolineaceae bacterium]
PCPFVIASPRRGRGNPPFEHHQIASAAPRIDRLSLQFKYAKLEWESGNSCLLFVIMILFI